MIENLHFQTNLYGTQKAEREALQKMNFMHFLR